MRIEKCDWRRTARILYFKNVDSNISLNRSNYCAIIYGCDENNTRCTGTRDESNAIETENNIILSNALYLICYYIIVYRICVMPRRGGIPIRSEYHKPVAWRATSITVVWNVCEGRHGEMWTSRSCENAELWTMRAMCRNRMELRKRVRAKSIKVGPYIGLTSI